MGKPSDLKEIGDRGRVGVVLCDPAGSVRWANRDAATLLGRSLRWAGSDPLRALPPEVGEIVRRCRGAGAAEGVVGAGERRILCRAEPVGTGGPGEGVLVTLSAARGSAGPGASGMAVHRQFQAIFDLSHDGLWIVDGEGFIVNLNRAAERLNGIRAAEVVGKSIDELVRHGVIDVSVTRTVLSTGRQTSMVQLAKRTGRRLLVTGTPSFGPDGGIDFVVVNERDITEFNELTVQLEEARKANERLQEEMAALHLREASASGIVAESPEMREVVRVALRLAQKNVSNILILGESGTGKGILARFIHSQSPRRDKPFIQINCAALPEALLEAELFGYEKGAFTGAADEGKPGLLEVADGGTLFLDEVGDMPFSIQAKILKYLDDHEIRRLGSTRTRVSRCAVIAATNHDLGDLVRQRRFRHDLYYRLNTFTLELPPLRSRRADVLALARHFVRRYNELYGTDKRLGRRAAEWLQRHEFPGNVRELESRIKNAVVMSEGTVLDEYLVGGEGRGGPGAGRTGAGVPGTLGAELARVERRLLEEAAAVCRSTREMARYLGTSQPTVVRKLRRYGISPPAARPSGV